MKKNYSEMPLIYKALFSSALVSVILLLNGCKKQDMLTQQNGIPDINNVKAAIVVHAGESIQAAVDAAQAGALIKIEPGTYQESITVNKPGIKLAGTEQAGVIIQNPGEEEDGIIVGDAGDGFSLSNVTVTGFEENGVLLDSVDNFSISHVTATNNGEYGIFPVHSSHGLIDHCTVSGHTDTGIYVGQSSDVNMKYNTATANVNGLEVENSSNINVTNNQSYDNVCGILIDLLPGKDIKTATNIYVANNNVYKNNHVNFGEEGSLESVVPSGLGILVLGADATTIEKNTVTGNDFSGITVFSTLVLVALGGITADEIDVEPNPDGTRVVNNVVQKNGANPPLLVIPLPGVDLMWDGSGTGNCWSNNKFKTSYPSPLPTCN